MASARLESTGEAGKEVGSFLFPECDVIDKPHRNSVESDGFSKPSLPNGDILHNGVDDVGSELRTDGASLQDPSDSPAISDKPVNGSMEVLESEPVTDETEKPIEEIPLENGSSDTLQPDDDVEDVSEVAEKPETTSKHLEEVIALSSDDEGLEPVVNELKFTPEEVISECQNGPLKRPLVDEEACPEPKKAKAEFEFIDKHESISNSFQYEKLVFDALANCMSKLPGFSSFENGKDLTSRLDAAKEKLRKATSEIDRVKEILQKTQRDLKAANANYVAPAITTRGVNLMVNQAAILHALAQVSNPNSGLHVVAPKPYRSAFEQNKKPSVDTLKKAVIVPKTTPIAPKPVPKSSAVITKSSSVLKVPPEAVAPSQPDQKYASIVAIRQTPGQLVPYYQPPNKDSHQLPVAAPGTGNITVAAFGRNIETVDLTEESLPMSAAVGGELLVTALFFASLTSILTAVGKVVPPSNRKIVAQRVASVPPVAELIPQPSVFRCQKLPVTVDLNRLLPKPRLDVGRNKEGRLTLTCDVDRTAEVRQITSLEVFVAHAVGTEFSAWSKLDEINVRPFPIVISLSEHDGKEIYCFAVRALKRRGPDREHSAFSNIVCSHSQPVQVQILWYYENLVIAMPEANGDESIGSKRVKPFSFESVESFLSDNAYKEMLENASSFNTRLLMERRMRLPFLDAQTGIAQNSSMLMFNRRDRMPGDASLGKLYVYPAAKWRKRKRQYHLNFYNFPRKVVKADVPESLLESVESTLSQSNVFNVEQKEENRELFRDDSAKIAQPEASWAYYEDELGLDEDDFYHVQDFDSDFDYEESSKKKKKKSRAKESTPKTSRGRKKGADENHEADGEKPVTQKRPSGRLKKNAAAAAAPVVPAIPVQDVQSENSTGADSMEYNSPMNTGETTSRGGDGRMAPSAYCDFCLGDAELNKKTSKSEEMVSCSDCGRSGHPTCLQFTANMIISVKKYRWQCIECKCCTTCGTSDNDDQLLFCDDCDRGYHMYCLRPPLEAPPDGSWSCELCVKEFHS
ncbi:unnamed protein product [Notodromas monacha]|uniref:PHD-type domain-containing protein n=1 Tax=Notodromas monacha TaxID=399045 RepID=A0A7R9BFQ4_9CRUS|nr:unnamed protein product [Notodromas monacha]CAG0914591.1 unnamed protein product [Notodromas monacha]